MCLLPFRSHPSMTFQSSKPALNISVSIISLLPFKECMGKNDEHGREDEYLLTGGFKIAILARQRLRGLSIYIVRFPSLLSVDHFKLY